MTNYDLERVIVEHAQWLTDSDTGQRANLLDADLRGVDLSGADLTDAILTGALLWLANLTGANLTNALLWGANLAGANLAGANLMGADLGRANLMGAILDPTRVLQLGPVGSRRDYLTVIRHSTGLIECRTGCFRGELADFRAAVAETHEHNPQWRAEYDAVLDYVDRWLALVP